MDPAASERRVVVPASVVWRAIGEEVLLLHTGCGEYFSLGSVGARFWALTAEGQPMSSTVARMLSEFDVEEARLRGDLEALQAELLARGLLELA